MAYARARRRVTADGPGPQGIPGRGIVSTVIDDARHLILTYSDGSVADAGECTGEPGEKGERGPQGRGLAGITSGNGRVNFTMSDGTVTSFALETIMKATS